MAVLVHRELRRHPGRNWTDILLTAAAERALCSSSRPPPESWSAPSRRRPVRPCRVPEPPPPLPPDPTQVQSLRVQPGNRPLRPTHWQRDRARLHLALGGDGSAAWASYVMSKAAAPPWNRRGPYPASEGPRPRCAGSLRGRRQHHQPEQHVPARPPRHARIVVAVLGLEKVPVRLPALNYPGGLPGGNGRGGRIHRNQRPRSSLANGLGPRRAGDSSPDPLHGQDSSPQRLTPC